MTFHGLSRPEVEPSSRGSLRCLLQNSSSKERMPRSCPGVTKIQKLGELGCRTETLSRRESRALRPGEGQSGFAIETLFVSQSGPTRPLPRPTSPQGGDEHDARRAFLRSKTKSRTKTFSSAQACPVEPYAGRWAWHRRCALRQSLAESVKHHGASRAGDTLRQACYQRCD